MVDGAPQAVTDIGGNGILRLQFNQEREQIAFIDNFHISACLGAQVLSVQAPDFSAPARNPNLSPILADNGQAIHGAAWNPTGDWLTFAKGDYSCDEAGPIYATPQVLVWNPATQAIQAFEYGSYPVWIP